MTFEEFIMYRQQGEPEPVCCFSRTIGYCSEAYSERCYQCEEAEKAYKEWRKNHVETN